MPKILPDIEKELLLKLRSGDQKAFNVLYQAYERKVYYNLKKLVHIPEIAGELHQDVFLKVWNKRAYLDPDMPFEGFLVTIARNCAIDFYRKAARDKLLTEQLALLMTEFHDPISEIIALKETNKVLEMAISKLPPQRGLVFRRIKMENQSYENTARHFGVSIGTIKDHMAKALQFVRAEISNSKLILLPAFIISALVHMIWR
ncbi:RNA polymerase sigma factor [Pedobacter nyackensis]|uniref:RNA polymerase sigma factor n=1 Tax=Pedobacter nyackensis TaxID=475255 RepID=UPI002930DD50|nr:sigma-70 family RNA polymerase sigma factor [Pedobacter nyackensis]